MNSGSRSPQGRRILIAPVRGEIGEHIQRWRERYEPQQARRIPPHATLCYWAPSVNPEALEGQVRHAFDQPVTVRLGGVHEFDNADRTFYIDLSDTARLDAARKRLFDGRRLQLNGNSDWTWHVTCVRSSRGKDLTELRAAASDLTTQADWQIDTISYLELRADRYETIAEWQIT